MTNGRPPSPLRRGLWRAMWPALFAFPAWVLLGRAFFGAPLGLQFLGQLVLVPALFVATAVGTLLVVARRSARRARAVSWPDAAAFLASWAGQLALGFFLVDGTTDGGSASAFTRLAGADALDLSTALFAVAAVVTLAGTAALVAGGAWQLVTETRARVAASIADLDALARQAQGAPRAHHPGAGPVITITPRDDPRH